MTIYRNFSLNEQFDDEACTLMGRGSNSSANHKRGFVIRTGWVALLCLFICADAQAQLYPLHAVEAQVFSNIGSDSETVLTSGEVGKFIPGELRQDLFRPKIHRIGGVYLGVGGLENYAMIAWARSELVILLNPDSSLSDLHQLIKICLLNADTPEAFLSLWKEDSLVVLENLVRDEVPDQIKRNRILKVMYAARTAIEGKLEEFKMRDGWVKTPSFVSNQEQYSHLVTLARSKRIFTANGELSGRVTMREISELLSRYSYVLRVGYWGREEQSLRDTAAFYKNIMRLPTDGTAQILRTRSWNNSLPDGTPGPIQHSYSVQSFSNLREWVQREAEDEVLEAIARDSKNDAILSFTKRP